MNLNDLSLIKLKKNDLPLLISIICILSLYVKYTPFRTTFSDSYSFEAFFFNN